VWQALRSELQPRGLEVVKAARPFIEEARPEHPSLVDRAHVVDQLFGMVNVPNGVWIDEAGTIVRAAEPAHPGRNPVNEAFRSIDVSTLPPDVAEMLLEARKIHSDPDMYPAMLRDWVEHGSASRFVHDADEVLRRSPERGEAHATAAARFELGQHLHRMGEHDAAIGHWREAHRLDPGNWTYKRNAWDFEDPGRQGRTPAYDSCWFDDVKAIGGENYYPAIVP
jgi:tetratricopeptide (TPR) repeat protein